MTTRKGFFAMLLGAVGLKAQEVTVIAVPCKPDDEECWFPRTPNGKCPVCGTVAEPFIPTTSLYCGDSVIFNPATRESMNGCEWDLRPGQSRITRCLRCNVAFWQDAEKARDAK